MKLIDKDALVVEIERLHKEHSSKYERDEAALVLDYLEDFLDTIEVKVVDLEKEISFQWSRFCLNGKNNDSFVNVAKHFFELGLKAKKEEVK